MPLSAQDLCFNANPMGCNGGTITTPWSFIQRSGVVTGGQYQGSGPFGKGFCSDFSLAHCHHHGPVKGDPYPAEGAKGCPHYDSPPGPSTCDAAAGAAHANFSSDKYTFKGSVQSASGEDSIKQFLMAGGPCETAFTVYADFEDYDTGVYHHVTGSPVGGHAVKIVGWGVDGGTKYWKVANSWNPYWVRTHARSRAHTWAHGRLAPCCPARLFAAARMVCAHGLAGREGLLPDQARRGRHRQRVHRLGGRREIHKAQAGSRSDAGLR